MVCMRIAISAARRVLPWRAHPRGARVMVPTVVFLVACGGSMTSGGFTVNKTVTEMHFDRVRNRASFELVCPPARIELQVVNASNDGCSSLQTPTQIGAVGCGHRGLYVVAPGGQWILNSVDGRTN